jgi:hypothetical protein
MTRVLEFPRVRSARSARRRRPDPAAPRERTARGVYWARYTKNGRPILYAVDSRGELVRMLTLADDGECRAGTAIELLWNQLDAADPLAPLHLLEGHRP